jgi:hypothetical protein
MPVREKDLGRLMDRVTAYSIVEAELDDGSTDDVTNVRRIIRPDATAVTS